VFRKFCIKISDRLSERFLLCSAWWSDVVEALNNREPLRKVRERREQNDERN
jgi:hypothetical protein